MSYENLNQAITSRCWNIELAIYTAPCTTLDYRRPKQ